MVLYILSMTKFEQSEYCTEQSKTEIHHQAGQYLLCQALGEDVYEQAEFAKNEHGKPYIIGHPIHYNISHSGQYVVLVTAEAEVGVDIQEKRKARMESVAKRFFSENEWQAVFECGRVEEKKDLFYHIWCRKEAYGKYLGIGLSNNLLSINMLEEPDNINFHDLEIIENYQISICSRKGEHLEKIISIFEGL